MRLRDDWVFESVNHHLLMRERERTGREASSWAAVIDSQSVKTTEAGGPRRNLDRLQLAAVEHGGKSWAIRTEATGQPWPVLKVLRTALPPRAQTLRSLSPPAPPPTQLETPGTLPEHTATRA